MIFSLTFSIIQFRRDLPEYCVDKIIFGLLSLVQKKFVEVLEGFLAAVLLFSSFLLYYPSTLQPNISSRLVLSLI
jgi:hypothetical protein